jgi:hypothetical protein
MYNSRQLVDRFIEAMKFMHHRSLASTKQLLLQATASHDEIIIIDRQEIERRSNARNNIKFQ